jgi:hypothetical protein
VSVTRYLGWTLSPPIVEGGPVAPVALAIDATSLIQWIGEPATVVQTPLEEVRDLEVCVGRRLRVSATLAGVRYRWSARRDVARDEFVELVRSHGGRVVRDRRRWVSVGVVVAAVTVLASVASLTTLVQRHHASAGAPSAHAVGSVNVSARDLPAGWRPAASGVLTTLVGRAGQVVTDRTSVPKLHGTEAAIWAAVKGGFQRCLGVTNAADRMFGAAGQLPAVQVSGTTFASSTLAFGEISSLTQWYARKAMVKRDLAEYSHAGFGRCWAESGARQMVSSLTGTLAAARATYLSTSLTPRTFARGWRRGGIATVSLPGLGTYQLVALVAARGHYEVDLYALCPQWSSARASVLGAFESMLARLSPGSRSGAA